MSSMTYPQWWTRSLAEAQERVSAGGSTFGEAVDFLVADLFTSEEFLSFLSTGTAGRMAAGDALDEAIYAVADEAAAHLQTPPPVLAEIDISISVGLLDIHEAISVYRPRGKQAIT